VRSVSERKEIVVVGSGFAGSLMARVLAVLGYDVSLLERGTHPRFAIGESSTPLANLSLERLASRYGFRDCYQLAAHGRWLETHPNVRRGLKRGFTFYRHHPGVRVDDATLAGERLLVAASPTDYVADSHWFRADVDHHFVQQAVSAGVDYRDRAEVTDARIDDGGVELRGRRESAGFEIHADFVIDASGPGGFLARALSIPSALRTTQTRSAIVFSHFGGVRLASEITPGLPAGPYPDDWAAVHHLIDEGWMYSLRFDHGVTSAGFVLSPRGAASLPTDARSADAKWATLLSRYPTIAAAFASARPVMPMMQRDRIQHRLARAVGSRWVLLPHAFAFVDPLFSTGIAWSLRAVERLALCFEEVRGRDSRVPDRRALDRYETMLVREADQIDRLVAGAYEAMAHFDLFAAQAMLYFATVSYAEVRQRLVTHSDTHPAWGGFLGVGDEVCDPLPRASLRRLRRITRGEGRTGSSAGRASFAEWVRRSIAPRNVVGLMEPHRRNLYPVDLDVLVDRHALLGLTRDQLVAGLPALRGMAPERERSIALAIGPTIASARNAGPTLNAVGSGQP
jgi:FADH2 O2-dependent halogenase